MQRKYKIGATKRKLKSRARKTRWAN